MTEKSPWTTKTSEIKYENAWLSVREDQVIRPDGSDGIYGVISSKHEFVLIVPRIETQMIMVRQYRYPVGKFMWEFPAGGIDEGETPEVAAARELYEEVGKKGELAKIGELGVSPGTMVSKGHIFLAEHLQEIGSNKMGEDGIDSMKAFSVEEIAQMIKNAEIVDAKTIAAYYMATTHE